MIELRDKAELIVENLSPLVGTKATGKNWSPHTGVSVCKSFQLAGLSCLDIDNDRIMRGPIQYTFDTSATVRESNLYKLVLEYSPIVLDPSYVIQVQERQRLASASELLYFQSIHKDFNDSAIIDIIESEGKLHYMPWKKHVMFVMLQCFALRFALYEFAFDGLNISRADVSKYQINRIINNIRYVRLMLQEYNADLTSDLCHHLATLQMNVQAVMYDITRYFLDS